jgi:hypothetical protein
LNYSQDIILKAIKDSGGIVSTVARRLDCQWITAKTYINKWEATKRAMSDEEETVLDMAESAVYKSIKEGNTQDAKWLLSTKGKNRGFSERQEITGKDGQDLPTQINIRIIKATHDA